jgi:S-adenosyl-L-methionine hydrolase (adenosine-forming)
MSLIALLTDFGTKDYFVAAMKGTILRLAPAARLVDVTHEIEPQDVRAAAFALGACWRDFPEKTIFVAVVDPGVGSERRAILVETRDYFFLAPDNGLLSFVFEPSPEAAVYELNRREFFAARVSSTFHGRDVFAPVAAREMRGVRLAELGAPISDFARLAEPAPRRLSATETEAEIIAVDRFGNLVTNLKSEDLPAEFALEIGGALLTERRSFYAEDAAGRPFMIFGSAGRLEISVFRGSAAKILQAAAGQKICVRAL